MPLKEPYVSPHVHRAAFRPDPATLPAAGCITNGQPIPRNTLSNRGTPTTGLSVMLSPLEQKAYHRKKHHPDPDMHLCGGARWEGSSTTKSCFEPHDVKRRPCKFDFSQTIPRGTLSGVGTPVDSLDLTSSWKSTKQLTIDFDRSSRTSLVERTYAAIAAGRQLEKWGTTTQRTFAGDSFHHLAVESIARRQATLMQRSTFKPLMTLS